MVKQRADLTFKENLKKGRHGWVRLTPAYSVNLVHEILAGDKDYRHVLDPFSGTGTTGLASAQLGLNATLVDINPFLIWLATVKTNNYSFSDLEQISHIANEIVDQARCLDSNNLWTPPISNIQRWWSSDRLETLARIYHQLQHSDSPMPVNDLLLIAFCRLVIDWSNASFNHQSMSFKDSTISLFDETEMMFSAFLDNVQWVTQGASDDILGAVNIYKTDSRILDIQSSHQCDCVITSPPYSNRMSYIRELRPYMYWLGYLEQARDAGELDWEAIGGTWGIATSRLTTWESQQLFNSVHLKGVVKSIAVESDVLANYVHKYIEDMYQHFINLKKLLTDDADIFYVVGNSKFYNTLVSVEKFYADMMAEVGFKNVQIKRIRKRNSKKELYEFLVSATNTP